MTVTRKKIIKTKAKSRTIARPALQKKRLRVLGRTWSFVGPVAYVASVLVLFQFISIQFALGYYEGPTPETPSRVGQVTPSRSSRFNGRATSGFPLRIEIPNAQVNAVVRPVGVTSKGAMGAPELPRDTVWYKHGPKPGEPGSAVIAGHMDWLYGASGVFKHLKSLKPGDLITVRDDQGGTTLFVVRKSREYGRKENATDVFVSTDGKAHLNLVTCSGVWDKVFKTYSKRLVVFADKVEETRFELSTKTVEE